MPGLGTTRHRGCIWADCSLSWVTSKRKRAYEGTRVRIADQREGTSGRRSGGEACRQDDRGRHRRSENDFRPRAGRMNELSDRMTAPFNTATKGRSGPSWKSRFADGGAYEDA